MAASVLDWLLERIGLVAVAVIFVFQVLRGIWRSAQSRPTPPAAKPDELEAQRLEREARAGIERRKAARRAAQPEAQPPPLVTRQRPAGPPPRAKPETTQMPGPFDGPLRRILDELQGEPRPAPPPLPPPVPVMAERRAAELERQQELADQMKALEESRALAQRRAAHLAQARAADAQSETGLRHEARAKILHDLHDPQSLRRAFVLREVLGPPVGLR